MARIKIVSAPNALEAGKAAAEQFISLIHDKPNAVLGLATGSSPLPIYNALRDAVAAKRVSFAGVHSVNLDEYVGLPGTHDQSYRYFMNENLFRHIDIDIANTYVPDGMNEDLDAACDAYEQIIEDLGGVDAQLLGIGLNGHIGFNEPAGDFFKRTHIVELTESTRDANKRFFASIDEVPTHAITMGIGTIFDAKKIVLICTGANKAVVLRSALNGPISPHTPASILQLHSDVTVYADEAALSLF